MSRFHSRLVVSSRAGVHTHCAAPFKGRQVSIRARCPAETPLALYRNGLAVVDSRLHQLSPFRKHSLFLDVHMETGDREIGRLLGSANLDNHLVEVTRRQRGVGLADPRNTPAGAR